MRFPLAALYLVIAGFMFLAFFGVGSLLLSEMEKYEEAAFYLGKAADGMDQYSRARYNQALAYLKLKQWEKGADTLKMAVFQDPSNEEYFITLVKLYLNFRMNNEALQLAEDVIKLIPEHTAAGEILKVMNQTQ